MDVHAGSSEVEAMLQLPSAVALVEAETSVYPEVTPVQPPASQHRSCTTGACGHVVRRTDKPLKGVCEDV